MDSILVPYLSETLKIHALASVTIRNRIRDLENVILSKKDLNKDEIRSTLNKILDQLTNGASLTDADRDVIFSREKFFTPGTVIGNCDLNKRGLHLFRLAAAILIDYRRRATLGYLSSDITRVFSKSGFLLFHNFLEPDQIHMVKNEISGIPNAENKTKETLVFGTAGSDKLLSTMALHQDVKLLEILAIASGMAMDRELHSHIANSAFIQTVVHQNRGRDVQKNMHRDTFHPAFKWWLFLNNTYMETGPFVYGPGSNRLTPERMAWEYRQSVDVTNKHLNNDSYDYGHKEGSFRANEDDMAELNIVAQPIEVPSNTLVIANVQGFHCRGDAPPGTQRRSLHGSIRRLAPLSISGL